MNVILGISILLNVLLALLLIRRELDHQEHEEEQATLNRCLREELCDLIRRGRLMV